MAESVVVKDVGELSAYCSRLNTLKGELETTVSRLVSLSEEMKEQANGMGNITNAQSSNWHDPQYEKLKDRISPCISSVKSTSGSIKDTASTVRTQMSQVEDSITYIRGLISKLSNIT